MYEYLYKKQQQKTKEKQKQYYMYVQNFWRTYILGKKLHERYWGSSQYKDVVLPV